MAEPRPHRPPDVDDLLAALAQDHLERNGVPDAATVAGRVRCRALVLELVADSGAGLVESPLGTGWTDVFEVTGAGSLDIDALSRRGWLRVDTLLPRSRTSASIGTWAVVESGRVLASVRLRRHGHPSDPVEQVLSRCRTRGEVRLREVAELRELRRQGHPLPAASPVITAAAEIESALGGRRLAPWASGRSTTAPARLPSIRGGPRRTVIVAVSGVDGSGKSTLLRALEVDLRRAGVPVSTVWVRPGMGLGRLVRLASVGKRALGQDPAPGIGVLARQRPEATRLRSRSGAVGWIWSTLVCASFLSGVWRQHLAASGVVLYDRHVVDALATLDFAYEGVDLRLQRAVVRAFFPRADLGFYLDVPAEVSIARKPDDVVAGAAVRRQLAAYEEWLSRVAPAHRLDATMPAGVIAATAMRRLVDAPARRTGWRLARRGFRW